MTTSSKALSPWQEKLKEKIEEHEANNISTKELRFFHVDILLQYAGHCEGFSQHCKACQEHQSEIDEITTNLNSYFDGSITGRNAYEKKFESLEQHLKKKHSLVKPNYNQSVFTLIGMIIGTLFGTLIGKWINPNSLSLFLLVGWFFGLVIGRIIGYTKEKKIKAQGRYL